MTFEWVSPQDTGGIELTGYNVYMAKGSGLFELVANAPSEINPSITI